MNRQITLNLVVLRSEDIANTAAFYAMLGLEFQQHQHGNGQQHLAAEFPGGVFELNPENPDGPSTRGTRVGFSVPSLDAIISSPKDSPWGRRAVVTDPDGHRVELLEKAAS